MGSFHPYDHYCHGHHLGPYRKDGLTPSQYGIGDTLGLRPEASSQVQSRALFWPTSCLFPWTAEVTISSKGPSPHNEPGHQATGACTQCMLLGSHRIAFLAKGCVRCALGPASQWLWKLKSQQKGLREAETVDSSWPGRQRVSETQGLRHILGAERKFLCPRVKMGKEKASFTLLLKEDRGGAVL